MRQTKVSLAMIVRDCAESLRRCLESVHEYVDEIVLVNTGIDPSESGFFETNQVAEAFGAKVFHFPWCEDFAKARNYSFEKCSNDIVMWLDSDDRVDYMDRFRENIDAFFSGGGCPVSLVAAYLYEFNAQGECTTVLQRERVVDRRCFEWRGEIHECLCQTWSGASRAIPDLSGRVIHAKEAEDYESSRKKLLRNLKVFEANYREDTWDKRTLFYWGNTFLGLKRFDEALEKYDKYLEYADNPPEIYCALNAASECARFLLDQERAKDYARRSIAMYPQWPSCYLAMAEACLANQEWDEAEKYATSSLQFTNRMLQETWSNPLYLKNRPWVIRMVAAARREQYQECLEYASQCGAGYEKDESFVACRDIAEDLLGRARVAQSWVNIYDSLDSDDQRQELGKLVPASICDAQEVASRVPKLRPASKQTIAILTTAMGEKWGPDSLETGIGGSEEAVIRVSRELALLGWHVEVYANTDFRGERDGIWWYPVSAWPGAHQRTDVSLVWRYPNGPSEVGLNTKVAYLWLHDVQEKGQWYRSTEDLYDGIMFLTEYHRSTAPWVSDEKVMRTANGITVKSMPSAEEAMADRNPHKMIWPSDPSRGLWYLEPYWEDIKEEFPEAELHVFYGWTDMLMQHKKTNKVLSDGYDIIENSLRKMPGVFWHGRVGQAELDRFSLTCGVWPYLTAFPEIYCINAIKMQALGVCPVSPRFAAMRETVKFGDLVNVGDKPESMAPPWPEQPEYRQHFIEVLKERLRNPQTQGEREKMVTWARTHTWAGIARQWDKRFKEDLECSQGYKVLERGQMADSLQRVPFKQKLESLGTSPQQTEQSLSSAV